VGRREGFRRPTWDDVKLPDVPAGNGKIADVPRRTTTAAAEYCLPDRRPLVVFREAPSPIAFAF